MPYHDENKFYTFYCEIDKNGNPKSGPNVIFQKFLDEAFMIDPITGETFCSSENKIKEEQEKMKEVKEEKNLLVKSFEDIHKVLKADKFLMVYEVLDCFDLKDPKLYDGTKEINPYDLYCGDLDEYKKYLHEIMDKYIFEAHHQENSKQILKYLKEIHLINEALSKVEGV